jgi:hypothetical protein
MRDITRVKFDEFSAAKVVNPGSIKEVAEPVGTETGQGYRRGLTVGPREANP